MHGVPARKLCCCCCCPMDMDIAAMVYDGITTFLIPELLWKILQTTHSSYIHTKRINELLTD
jgi:hypothetical protein